MTYSEKLKNPLWQKKRLDVFNRDNFTCTLCGDKETTLHVHHTEYERFNEPWEYPIEKLKTLCDHCHSVVEHYKISSFYPTYIYKEKNTVGFHMLCFAEENGINTCWICHYCAGDIIDVICLRENKLELLNNEFKKFKERNG